MVSVALRDSYDGQPISDHIPVARWCIADYHLAFPLDIIKHCAEGYAIVLTLTGVGQHAAGRWGAPCVPGGYGRTRRAGLPPGQKRNTAVSLDPARGIATHLVAARVDGVTEELTNPITLGWTRGKKVIRWFRVGYYVRWLKVKQVLYYNW